MGSLKAPPRVVRHVERKARKDVRDGVPFRKAMVHHWAMVNRERDFHSRRLE